MAAKEKLEEVLIINRRTGKALHCSGMDNGQVVIQSAPTGEDAQIWDPVRVEDGVKLINKASGKVLDVVHGGTEAGTWAQTWEDVGGGSQVWKLAKITATYRKIVNVQAGKVLDIVDMREDDGAPAQIWDDVDGSGQQWKLVPPADFAAKGAKSRTAKSEAAPAGKEPAQEEEPKPVCAPAGKAEAAEEAPKAEAVEAKPVEKPAAEVKTPAKRGRKPKAVAPAEPPKTPAKRGRKPGKKA